MKFIALLITTLFLTFSYAKTLRIGTTPDNPSFASLASEKNSFYGFEIDIMMEVCSRISVHCQFQPIVVRDALTLLNNNQLDLVIAAIIRPSPDNPKSKNLLFSAPYLFSSAQFLVNKNSSHNNLQGLRNKKVGVRLSSVFGNTVFKDYVYGLYNRQIIIHDYSGMADLIYALRNNEVNAIFSNTEAIMFWYMNNKDQYRLVGEPFVIGDGYSIIGKRGSEALMIEINQALYDMEQDGTYVTLYNRYFTL